MLKGCASDKEAGESGCWMRPAWFKRKERRRGHVKEVKFRGGYSQGISPFQ